MASNIEKWATSTNALGSSSSAPATMSAASAWDSPTTQSVRVSSGSLILAPTCVEKGIGERRVESPRVMSSGASFVRGARNFVKRRVCVKSG